MFMKSCLVYFVVVVGVILIGLMIIGSGMSCKWLLIWLGVGVVGVVFFVIVGVVFGIFDLKVLIEVVKLL